MKDKKIALVVILGLSLTGLFNISFTLTQGLLQSGVDDNIWDEIEDEDKEYTPYSSNGFKKMAFLIFEEVEDGIIDVGEKVNWSLVIVVINFHESRMENVTVTDILPPQLEVYKIVFYDGKDLVCDKKDKKQNGATHIAWSIGDLEPGQIAVLDLTIVTATNPAGKQHFISSGTYHLNSGAKLKFTLDGSKYCIHTEKIEFEVPGEMPYMPTLLTLHQKDQNWVIVNPGTWGKLIFDPISPTFNYIFYGSGLEPDTSYDLIYYADPWPGNHPGMFISTNSTNGYGKISMYGSMNLGMDLPHPSDENYNKGGAKIWLVLSNDYDDVNYKMTNWQPDRYLFEHNLITYDDSNFIYLFKKDANWQPIIDPDVWGSLEYNSSGSKFEYDFHGFGLESDKYSLIYYADPWPGNHPGALIDKGSTTDSMIHLFGAVELNIDLPDPADANYPDGAKIWLVLSNDYDEYGPTGGLTHWNPSMYLFENQLITYDDTDVMDPIV